MLSTPGNCFFEKYWIFSLHQNLDSHQFTKRAIDIDFFHRYLKTSFSTTIRFIFSIRVPIESLTFMEDDPIGKRIFLTRPSLIPVVRKFKKCLILLICLDNQTLISHYLQVWFIQPRSPSKTYRLGARFN